MTTEEKLQAEIPDAYKDIFQNFETGVDAALKYWNAQMKIVYEHFAEYVLPKKWNWLRKHAKRYRVRKAYERYTQRLWLTFLRAITMTGKTV